MRGEKPEKKEEKKKEKRSKAINISKPVSGVPLAPCWKSPTNSAASVPGT